MALDAPVQAVLSESFQEAIGGRRVKTAVFLTYELDPEFFEQKVLPLLFNRTFGHKAVRLAQLEDALRDMEHLAVYYDRRGLQPTPCKLPYDRFGLGRPTGVFHAKNVFLILENRTERGDEVRVEESLLIMTTSANLTESGWHRNVEVADIRELRVGDRSLLRDDLVGQFGLLSRVTGHDKSNSPHAAIEAVRTFLLRDTGSMDRRTWAGRLRERMFVGQKSLPAFLREDVGLAPDTFNLEVIAPFVGNDDEAATLRRFVDMTEPIAVRVMVPTDGVHVTCKKEYFDAVDAMPRVSWAELRRSVVAWSERRKEGASRFVHAKVYRFFSPQSRQDILVIGSPNLTDAAHSPAHKHGNFETAIVVDVSDPDVEPAWWLKKTGERAWSFQPREAPEEKGLADLDVSLMYDWKENTLEYFWGGDTAPSAAELHDDNASLGEISPVALGRWERVTPDIAARVRQRILGSSLITVSADGREQRVLVGERHSDGKPDRRASFTPEEILEYWSLLTPDQRDAFLERVIEARLALLAREAGSPDLPSTPSMFDRFAGIFHAFSCLEERIGLDLDQGRIKQATCVLFGAKFDSLPTLVEATLNEGKLDHVNRYVTLLCARQMVERLRHRHREQLAHHKDDLGRLNALLVRIRDLREGLMENDADRHKFLDWFEGMFDSEPVLPAEAAP